jgi:hypothetical protein
MREDSIDFEKEKRQRHVSYVICFGELQGRLDVMEVREREGRR